MSLKLPCVCEICNCGRHKCPHKLHRPGPWDKCNLSEYNTSYVPHEACPSKPIKPHLPPMLGDGPLSSETTHRVDFIPRCAEPPIAFKPPDYIKPEGSMDDITMYRKEFGPKESCPVISIKPAPSRSVPAKFEGESTNRRDFRPWDLPPPVIRKVDEYVPSCDKFDGIPSYTRDYITHCQAPPKGFKPLYSFMQSKDPLSQDTNYRQTYVNHPLEPKVKKKDACYIQTRTPLDSLTTHKKEYTPKEICRQKSYKPPPHFIQVDKPLSDETTHRVDYKLHDTERPYKYEPDKYRKPEGEIDLKTTYGKDFINLPACKTDSIKQPPTRKVSAPFHDGTNYRDEFQKWDIPPVKPIHRDIYQPPTDRFDDCTTFKSAYVPHEMCQVQSYKPKPHMLSKEPFDDATMYRTEYTNKLPPYCPAARLNTNPRSVSPDGYIFHNEDSNGHLHYRRGVLTSGDAPITGTNANNKEGPLVSDEASKTIVEPLAA